MPHTHSLTNPLTHSPTPLTSSLSAKARRAAELQARIQAQLAGKPLLLTVAATMTVGTGKTSVKSICLFVYLSVCHRSKPVPLVLDAEGKVDLPMAIQQPTLKVY